MKMLKWIKVRQNTSATPTSCVSHQQIKDNETRVEVKIKEEGEDSGMEKEDSVCNVELSDLKKVRLCLLTSPSFKS